MQICTNHVSITITLSYNVLFILQHFNYRIIVSIFSIETVQSFRDSLIGGNLFTNDLVLELLRYAICIPDKEIGIRLKTMISESVRSCTKELDLNINDEFIDIAKGIK